MNPLNRTKCLCMCLECLLEADSLLIKWQHQQNSPPAQKTDILQQKHQPGSLVVYMNHGGKLEWEKEMQWGKSEVKMTFLCVFYHLYTYSVTQTLTISASPTYRKSPAVMAAIHCLEARSVATDRAIYKPMKEVMALPMFKSSALRTDMPLWSKMAKSPGQKQERQEDVKKL